MAHTNTCRSRISSMITLNITACNIHTCVGIILCLMLLTYVLLACLLIITYVELLEIRHTIHHSCFHEDLLRFVRQHEIARIKAVVTDLGAQTKLCFLIVTKNISTRIFARRRRGFENPLSYTLSHMNFNLSSTVCGLAPNDYFLITENLRN